MYHNTIGRTDQSVDEMKTSYSGVESKNGANAMIVPTLGGLLLGVYVLVYLIRQGSYKNLWSERWQCPNA